MIPNSEKTPATRKITPMTIAIGMKIGTPSEPSELAIVFAAFATVSVEFEVSVKAIASIIIG